MIENILALEATHTGLWVASWVAVVLLGVGPLAWALQQRFGGGLSQAMGYYRRRARRGRPCERRQCFLNHLDQDIEQAGRVLRGRAFYTAGYIAAVLAPAIALGVYATFQNYFWPGTDSVFVSASSAEPVSASMGEIAGFFLISGNFFVAIAGDELAADIPVLASVVSKINYQPTIALNPAAGVFSTLVALFKWMSGPAVLFSAFVITEISGGFRRIDQALAGFREAREQLEQQPDDRAADEYRGLIDRVVETATTRLVR